MPYGGEGSRGGVVIGHTQSGRPIYATSNQNRMPRSDQRLQADRDRKQYQEQSRRHADFEKEATDMRRKRLSIPDAKERMRRSNISSAKEGDIVRVARKGRGRTHRGNIGRVLGRSGENVHVLMPSGSKHEFHISDLEFAKSSIIEGLFYLVEFEKAAGKPGKTRSLRREKQKSGKIKEVWYVKQGQKWVREKTARPGKKQEEPKKRNKKKDPELDAAFGKGEDEQGAAHPDTKKFLKENFRNFEQTLGGSKKELETAVKEYGRAKNRYDQLFAGELPDLAAMFKEKPKAARRFNVVRFVHDKLKETDGGGRNGDADEKADARTPGGSAGSATEHGGNRRRGKNAGNPEKPKPPTTITHRENLTKKGDPNRVPLKFRSIKNPDGTAALDEYQTQAASLMLASADAGREFLLADGTGTGKTRAILAYSSALSEEKKKPVLVVTANRKVIISNMKDANVLGVSVSSDAKNPVGVTYVTYDDVKNNKVPMESHTGEKLYAGVVFDEAQKIKNTKGGMNISLRLKESRASKAAFKLKSAADHSIFASATPLDKTDNVFYLASALGTAPMELASMFGYRAMLDKKTGKIKLKLPKDHAMSVEEKREIIDNLFSNLTSQGFMIQRESKNAYGMERNVETVKLNQEQMKEVEGFGKKYRSDAAAAMHQRRILEKYKIRKAVEIARDHMKKNPNGQTVIYFDNITSSTTGTRKSSLNTLKVYFPEAEILTGGQGGKKTKLAIDNFQSGKSKVVLVQSAYSAGISLDDTIGNAPRHMIIMTPPLAAIEAVQMEGRIDRKSTRSKAQFTYLATDHFADSWATDLIQEKAGVMGGAVKGKPEEYDIAGPYEEGVKKTMTGQTEAEPPMEPSEGETEDGEV